MTDPETGAPKRFGFCDFEHAEGLLRTLRLLKDFSLLGSELALNCNQARARACRRCRVERACKSSDSTKAR